jgi:hypothetical protein
VLLLSVVVTACGKRGPPLAPLHLVPEAPAEVTLRRVDDTAVLKLTLPKKNANGPGAVELDRLEVYAVTAAPGAVVPPDRELLAKKYLVGTIGVKPPPVEDAPPEPDAAEDKRPSSGDVVTFSEELTAEKLTPALLPLPRRKPPVKGTGAEAAPVPAAGPAITYPVRIYALRGMTRAGRPGAPAPRLQLPLVALPSPPIGLVTLFDEKGVLVAWLPPLSGEPPLTSMLPRVSVEAVLPPITGVTEASLESTIALLSALPMAPPSAVENPFFAGRVTPPPATAASAATATAAAPLAFNVYEPDAVAPLNTAPLPGGSFRHPGAEFAKEQCFTVRTVKTVAGVGIEGEPSPPICLTPRDVFPPAAPARVNAVAGPGAISLIWDANTDPDLAGYIVLRGEAPGDTLQPLMKAPIAETNYRDATVTPGVRYVYVVVAVDNATPPNTSARTARVEETAR